MKVILWIIIIFLVGGFLLTRGYSVLKQQPSTITPTTSLDPKETNSQTTFKTVSYKGRSYAYDFFLVSDVRSLNLVPNFIEKKTSGQLKETYGCTAGINGSYYDKTGNPLGGFTYDGRILRNPIYSRLMDGFISVDDSTAALGFTPLQAARIVLQSGPLLIIDREVPTLKIASDEPARRSVAAITADHKLLFLTVFDSESNYSGPYLADLPTLIQLISKQLPSPIMSAINLDGGNASAFFNSETSLSELTHVGSLFCVR